MTAPQPPETPPATPPARSEEQELRERVLPELLALQRDVEAKGGSADETMLQLGNGTKVPFDKYIRNALFHYAHVIANEADAAQKWQDMMEQVRAVDPFTAGTIAAAAVLNIDAFKQSPALGETTLALAGRLGSEGIFREALDSAICTWLSTTDPGTKTKAADITTAIIAQWEGYQPPRPGIPNEAPRHCAAFLRDISRNPEVRGLVETLRPGLFAVPAANAPSSPPPPAIS